MMILSMEEAISRFIEDGHSVAMGAALEAAIPFAAGHDLYWREKEHENPPSGSGGASDIASLAGRFVIIMDHERRRFPEKVSYVTSPGFGDGRGWRGKKGLKGGGPSAVVTTRGVMRFDPSTREMILRSVHPGATTEDILQNTGWDLKLASEVDETRPPTRTELRIIRRLDPQGFWTGGRL